MSNTELAWFKSSYSGTSGDNCVEVAASTSAVRVRDSKIEQSPQLAVEPTTWSAFVAYATGH
jgi:hypothetical protein